MSERLQIQFDWPPDLSSSPGDSNWRSCGVGWSSSDRWKLADGCFWIGGGIGSDVGSAGCSVVAAGDVSTGSNKAGLSLSKETVSGLPQCVELVLPV